MQLNSIKDAGNLAGKAILLRASLNVPLENHKVRNQFRLEKALPTLEFLQKAGARVVVVAHIGRDPSDTLLPVHQALQAYIEIKWGGEVSKDNYPKQVSSMQNGELILFENLRQDDREYENDTEFAKLLTAPVDLYVNDAFANAHREHASMSVVANCVPAYAGIQLQKEVEALEEAMSPQSPSLFILGGAKFATKLNLVDEYLELYDQLFIGGALLHDIMRARGLEIGRSLTSEVSLSETDWLTNEKLVLPQDVLVRTEAGATEVRPLTGVLSSDTIYDCGPDTIAWLEENTQNAQTILWNGPLGNYESGYVEGTEALAKAIAKSNADSYVGGGDTVAAISSLELFVDFTFVSTGGGAMLAFLEKGTLPTLELLQG